MAPPVTKVGPSTVDGPNEETRAKDYLSNTAIFGDFLPSNRTDYLPLFGVIYALQDYVGGKGNEGALKAKIQAWAKASNYGDPINQGARSNILKILDGIKDADLKARAKSALAAIQSNSKEVAASPAKPVSAAAKDPVPPPSKDPAKIPAPAPLSAKSGAPKVGMTDLKKWREAKDERESKLSDKAIGWNPDLSVKYPLVAFAIMVLRDYMAGRDNQADYVRSKLLYWRRHPDFEKDPALKSTYQNLMKALSLDSLKAEYNLEPAAKMFATMTEVDRVSAGLPPMTPTPAPKKPTDDKKPKDDKKPATPPPTVTSTPSADVPQNALALMSDSAVFGDQLSAWNDPSVKSGKGLALSSTLYALRDYLDAKGDYKDGNKGYKLLGEKVKAWEKSSFYQEGLSYRARTNLISILSGVDEKSPLYKRAQGALLVLKSTKAIDPPKAPEPPAPKVSPAPAGAVPVTYVEFDTVPDAKAPSVGKESVDSFKKTRLDIAQREHVKVMSKSGKSFDFSGDVYVEVNPQGEISKVTYKNVTAVRHGDTGENVTSAEVVDLMRAIANAYRNEVKFAKVEKNKIGFRLELVATSGAAASPTPATPPPPTPTPTPVVTTSVEPKTSDPVKGNYSFSYSSTPAGLERNDGPDNAQGAILRSISGSKMLYQRYLKTDESLTLSSKALIETSPATGYVTKVSFSDIKYTGGMTGKMTEEIFKKFADQLNSSTRWKAIKQGKDEYSSYSLPIKWVPSS